LYIGRKTNYINIIIYIYSEKALKAKKKSRPRQTRTEFRAKYEIGRKMEFLLILLYGGGGGGSAAVGP